MIHICHLNRLLRYRSHCQLIGPPPLSMVVKFYLRNLQYNPLKTNQGNPFMETLSLLLLLFPLLICNLLVTQVSRLFNKSNLVSSKAIPLDKVVNKLLTRTNPMSSIVQCLDNLLNHSVNLRSSIHNPLGRLVSPKHSWTNQLPNLLNHLVY